MEGKKYIEVSNSQAVAIKDIPLLDYDDFYDYVVDELKIDTHHCLNYYCVDFGSRLWFVCCIACDELNIIRICSHELPKGEKSLRSITPECFQLHIFEREIHENFRIHFKGHPWLKPVRSSFKNDGTKLHVDAYPFLAFESEELHEVGVGPIHAGIIEPGHFRFICHGEKVLHLEISLGYKHRGIEQLFVKQNGLQRTILTESVAGDTAVGSSIAHAQLIESLADLPIPESLMIERCIGLELERFAIHIGDTSALCTDVAYQLGQVVNEALRTTIINTTQFWCGNRFGKGLVRPGGSNYPLNETVVDEIRNILKDSGNRYIDMADRIYTLPTVLSRFDGIGELTPEQAILIGAVGMAARSTSLGRDIRKSHPFQYFNQYQYEPVVLTTGDVLARGMLRYEESKKSVSMVNEFCSIWEGMAKEDTPRPVYDYGLKPLSFAISVVEAWRGELCHSAITDEQGNLAHYKIKDPSLHNWMALALAVRNQEISDFPVCNKSFNLSYCGNDI